MAGLIERDKVSGQTTTGHEWNGIKELNTPVPRLLWAFLITATIFSVTWTVLMPSWPGIRCGPRPRWNWSLPTAG